MADTTLLPGMDTLWVTLGSLGAALVVAAGAPAWNRRKDIIARRGRGILGALGRTIAAGDAWTPTDSWLTNITTITGALSTFWVALTSPGEVFATSSVDGPLIVLFLLFTASAALAPVIYAAFGATPQADAVKGTVRGYLLAAVAVLFGAFGMMATLCAFAWDAFSAIPATRDLVLAFSGLGALLTATYAARTVASAVKDSKKASFLVAPGPKRSATL